MERISGQRWMCVWLLAACLCIAPGALATGILARPDGGDGARERPDAYYEEMERLGFFSAITEGLFQSEALTEVDPTKPVVALTFDDGPSRYTLDILALLAQHGGRATFFMIGERIEDYPAITAQVAREGHEVGTHSWSHPKLPNLSADKIRSQLTDSANAIAAQTGGVITLMRPPYGSVNTQVKAICEELGMPVIRWSIDTEDWRTKDPEATYDVIVSQVQNGSIILCHDVYAETLTAMERVIPELVRRGYQLVTVSELFRHAGNDLVPGQVYDRVEW